MADKKAELLAKLPKPKTRPKTPVWEGPGGDGPNGGVTFSLLSRFLTCRERFRLRVVEGLKPAEQFSHRIEYGNMWHVCEEAVAAAVPNVRRWDADLLEYEKGLAKKYPLAQDQVSHWYEVCRLQFAEYLKFWSSRAKSDKVTPLLAEQVFDVPYKLPSGRVVRLRGKSDSVFMKSGGVWLHENKTKGDIDETAIRRQLTWDLQTMLYLVAMVEGRYQEPLLSVWPKGAALAGVRYNVVRRPLSGGKGTIVRLKPSKSNPAGESRDEYYDRVVQYIRDEPETYFMRWDAGVTPPDVARFRRECLDPILEQLTEWWEVMKYVPKDGPFSYHYNCHDNHGLHWRHPFGVVNNIDEYGHGDLDQYLESKSEVGLIRTDNLFPELG